MWREYDLTSVPLNREAAQNLLQDRLRVYLEQPSGPEGEVVTTDYSAQIQGDSMEVSPGGRVPGGDRKGTGDPGHL